MKLNIIEWHSSVAPLLYLIHLNFAIVFPLIDYFCDFLRLLPRSTANGKFVLTLLPIPNGDLVAGGYRHPHLASIFRYFKRRHRECGVYKDARKMRTGGDKLTGVTFEVFYFVVAISLLRDRWR